MLYFYLKKEAINHLGTFFLFCPLIFILETMYIIVMGLDLPLMIAVNQLPIIFSLCLSLFALFGEHFTGRLRKHMDLYLFPLLALTILEYVIIYIRFPFDPTPYCILIFALSGFYLIMVRQLRSNTRLIAEQHQTITHTRTMMRSIVHDLANIVSAASGWSSMAFKAQDEHKRTSCQAKAVGAFTFATEHIKSVTAILSDEGTVVNLSQISPAFFCDKLAECLKNNHVGDTVIMKGSSPDALAHDTLLIVSPDEYSGKLIYADTHTFGNALINLVSNAKKAGASDIAIEITESEGKTGLQINFKDNGRGIPAQKVDRLFKERVESANGTGVGLLGVRMIINCHNADIAVVNPNSDGTGTTEFCIKPISYVN